MKALFHPQRIAQIALGFVAATLMLSVSRASTNVFDFNQDPNFFLTIYRSGDNAEATALAGEWFSSDGSTLEGTDASTNGYLAITQGDTNNPAGHGHRAAILFDDFDIGQVIAAFTFQCDLRVGAGSDVPADGFSLNYCRNSDPVILNANGDGFASRPDGNEANLPEEGTQTGLAICFDAWQSGDGDVVGMTVRVDNNIITNIALPTANGECDDATSAQTGPNTNGLAGLCWQPLFAELTTDGLLNVSWKGVPFLTNFAVPFAPSPGRLIFAGRVGGNNQETDVDNIRITTIPSAKPVVGPSTGNANGFKVTISDSGFATPDTNTLTMELDGSPVPISYINQDYSTGSGFTMLAYQDTSLVLAPGSVHTTVIHFTGSTFDGSVDATNQFTVPNYTVLTTADQAPGTVNTALPGFSGRMHQLPIPRYPSPSDIAGIERQLADGYIDRNTGMPYASIALVSDFTDDDSINWGQDVAIGGDDVGFFGQYQDDPMNVPDEAIPGTDRNAGDPNNLASELITILDLPVGAHRLGMRPDDRAQLKYGPEPRDQFLGKVLAGGINGEVTVDIVVTNAGMYPVRIAWGENGGGAGMEFYTVDFITGDRKLINDPTHSGTISSYRDLAALTLPYLSSVYPAPGEAAFPVTDSIVVKFEDGPGGTVNDGSITINGQTPAISNNGNETTATLADAITLGVNTATLVYSTTVGGPYTNTWTFGGYTEKSDVTTIGDPIEAYQPNGGSSPGNEGVTNVIANFTQKYLNFGDGQTPVNDPLGFIVTPSMGTTVVSGMRLYSANDATDRDPRHVVLEGSYNGGQSWTVIFSGDVTLPDGRNNGSTDFGTTNVVNTPINPDTQYVKEIEFENNIGYSSYRWYTDLLKGNTSLMQVAEVELLGVPGALPPFLSVELVDGQVVITANQEGTLQSTTDFSGWGDVGPIGPTSGPVMVTPSSPNETQLYRLLLP